MPVVDAGALPSSPRGLAKEIVQVTSATTINANHMGRLLQEKVYSSLSLASSGNCPMRDGPEPRINTRPE